MFRVIRLFVPRATIMVLHMILNTYTMTVHKHESGSDDLHAVCGATHHLSRDQLREITAERAVTDGHATRCGRCFDDGGGY